MSVSWLHLRLCNYCSQMTSRWQLADRCALSLSLDSQHGLFIKNKTILELDVTEPQIQIQKPKDTRVLEVYETSKQLLHYVLKIKKGKFKRSNCFFSPRGTCCLSAINILAHKYLWQPVPSSGSAWANACWVRKWRIFQMLLPSICSILFNWEKRSRQPSRYDICQWNSFLLPPQPLDLKRWNVHHLTQYAPSAVSTEGKQQISHLHTEIYAIKGAVVIPRHTAIT